MKQTEIIGLKESNAVKISESLNNLLADYHIFYMNLRGLHWNIKGAQFFALHNKFEELYDDAAGKIDEIAERILSLGQKPVHTLEEYVKKSKLDVVKDVSEAKPALQAVLDGFKYLIEKQRQLLEQADELGDEGTNAMMSDYISEQEKLVWMFLSTTK